MKHSDCIARAIKAAGGTGKLAELIGVTSQAISQWNRIPAERVVIISKKTGLDRHELRPDLWEAPKQSVA